VGRAASRHGRAPGPDLGLRPHRRQQQDLPDGQHPRHHVGSDWNDGFYTDKPPITGIKAMAAIYAGWGLSEPFYREGLYTAFGARDVTEFVDQFWDAFFIKCDANDLLAQMWTWWHNDVGDHPSFGGDFDAALGAITARTIILNAETDQYFPPADSDAEAERIPGAESRPIPTIWGHMAPFNPDDQAFIDRALSELLDG
jgi:homoserine O-acetyltransferase